MIHKLEWIPKGKAETTREREREGEFNIGLMG